MIKTSRQKLPCVRWTLEEVAILKKYFKKLGAAGMQKYLPHKNQIQIRSAAAKRGLKTKNWNWSTTETELLKKFYASNGQDRCAHQSLLKTRNHMAIMQQTKNLGLKKTIKVKKFGSPWTKKEISLLKKYYTTKNRSLKQKLLNKHKMLDIYNMAFRLKLGKNRKRTPK